MKERGRDMCVIGLQASEKTLLDRKDILDPVHLKEKRKVEEEEGEVGAEGNSESAPPGAAQEPRREESGAPCW